MSRAADVVDQDALIDALQSKSIEAALLDVTTPEPLPEDHPLWSLENAQVTMHLSGRAQTKMFQRSVDRFVVNLERLAQRANRLSRGWTSPWDTRPPPYAALRILQQQQLASHLHSG